MTEVTSFSPGRDALQSGAAGDDPDRGGIARGDPGEILCNVILTTDNQLIQRRDVQRIFAYSSVRPNTR